MRKNSLSTVRSRSSLTKKAGNLAAILIVIGKNIPIGCFVSRLYLKVNKEGSHHPPKGYFPILINIHECHFLSDDVPGLQHAAADPQPDRVQRPQPGEGGGGGRGVRV